LKVNVSLLQFSWKAVPQFQTSIDKTPVSKVAVGLSDNTRPWCGRTQLVKHAGKTEVNNLAVKLIQQPTQMFPNKQSPRL